MNTEAPPADLLGSEPYWWREAPRSPAATQIELPNAADVVIIGSGYAGVSAARTLAAHGRDVVVLEQGRIGEGASTRNGGAVGETLRMSFSKLKRKFGEQTATDLYLATREARAFIEDLIARESIDCAYQRCGRVICAHREADYESLARDLEERRRAIGFDADMVPRSDLPSVVGSDAFAGARVIHSDGNLHPGLFHDGLVRLAKTAGARFSAGTEVCHVRTDTSRVFRLDTTRGSITARDVVIATNGYTGSHFSWLARRIMPLQSQIMATEPLPRETLESLIPLGRQMGDTRKLHNYWRISPDGERLLFGGRAGAAETRDRGKSIERLRAQMLTTYPVLDRVAITHAWAGYIAYTFDALPHIGQHQGVHYIGGCCGSGVAMQPYLGHQTALKVLGETGRRCPFDTAYKTVPGYFGKPWFMPAVIALLGVMDRRPQFLSQKGRPRP